MLSVKMKFVAQSGIIATSTVIAFVPLDSRASSRMTARGAVSRLTLPRRHPPQPLLMCSSNVKGDCLCSSGFSSKLENDGAEGDDYL